MAAQSLHMAVHEALGGCPKQHVADHNVQDGCPRLGDVAEHVSVVWLLKAFTWLPRMDERWTSMAAQSEVALGERGSPRLGVSGSEWTANLGGWWWCMADQNPHVAAQNFVGVVWTLVVSHIVGVRGLAWLPKLWQRLDVRGLVKARKSAAFGRPHTSTWGCNRGRGMGDHAIFTWLPTMRPQIGHGWAAKSHVRGRPKSPMRGSPRLCAHSWPRRTGYGRAWAAIPRGGGPVYHASPRRLPTILAQVDVHAKNSRAHYARPGRTPNY